MGGGSGVQETTVRLAPYIEEWHKDLLGTYDVIQAKLIENWSWDHMGAAGPADPYDDYTELDIEAAFFGVGYTLSSFPSLYDMYGKFMAGLDVEVLFDEHFEDTINGTVVNNVISAEADILSDDLENEAIPRFEEGMRDINSVMSSTFVVGKAMMEVGRTKAISRFSADLRGKLLPVVVERWRSHLDWNKAVIDSYAQILKFYLSAEMDVDSHNREIVAKHLLWPYTILDQSRMALGSTTGAQDVKSKEVAGQSRAAKALGGALMGGSSGAMIGAEIGAIGGPLGAGVGALVGFIGGLL